MAYPAGPYLVDTSILIRLDDTDPQARQEVLEALQQLSDVGNPLHLVPQSLVEFWSVATRPRANNGLGLTPNQAQVRIAALQVQFDVLPETSALFVEWEQFATAAQVSGRQVHDTRLAAFAVVHNLPNILTRNAADFRRFVALTGISVVEPASKRIPNDQAKTD